MLKQAEAVQFVNSDARQFKLGGAERLFIDNVPSGGAAQRQSAHIFVLGNHCEETAFFIEMYLCYRLVLLYVPQVVDVTSFL
jgi:hypothetical protein